MRKLATVSIIAVGLLCAAALGDPLVTKVVFQISTYGVESDFTATGQVSPCGTLVWSNGAIATIYTTDPLTPFVTAYPNVNATFTDGTDTSSGGVASATFDTMDFTVDIYADSAKTTLLGNVSGELYGSWAYTEGETFPGSLYGSTVITITEFNIVGYTWAEPVGSAAGLTATTTLPGDIQNYLSNWSSDNTVVTIMADENGIPEPATITLLGLGLALFIRRR